MIGIDDTTYRKTSKHAFTHSGFRPFFLGATVWAIVSMLFWMLSYIYAVPIIPTNPLNWHAHEMIFGYSLAIIVGFLLTAVRNWTRAQTLDGSGLMVAFVLWLLARIIPLIPFENNLIVQWLLETIFFGYIIYTIGRPLILRKLKRNYLVLVVLFFLFLSNTFYHYNIWDGAFYLASKSNYLGLFVVMTIILVFVRRLIPNFIQAGLRGEVKLKNYRWIDILYIPLFICFSISYLLNWFFLLAVFSLLLFCLSLVRLISWHRVQIWGQPLLWSLYVAYAWIVFSFGLFGILIWYPISPSVSMHGLTMGGIGMITMSMVARVSLGHTGRSIFKLQKSVMVALVLLVLGVVIRVLGPLLAPEIFELWIKWGMIWWILSYFVLLISYWKIWTTPRADGQYG